MLASAVVTVAFLRRVVEQAPLAEVVARAEPGDLLAVAIDDDGSIDDRVEGVRGRALDDDVDAVRQRAELRRRRELLQHELRDAGGDRQPFHDRHARRPAPRRDAG